MFSVSSEDVAVSLPKCCGALGDPCDGTIAVGEFAFTVSLSLERFKLQMEGSIDLSQVTWEFGSTREWGPVSSVTLPTLQTGYRWACCSPSNGGPATIVNLPTNTAED